jgi:hypothetical protein
VDEENNDDWESEEISYCSEYPPRPPTPTNTHTHTHTHTHTEAGHTFLFSHKSQVKAHTSYLTRLKVPGPPIYRDCDSVYALLLPHPQTFVSRYHLL